MNASSPCQPKTIVAMWHGLASGRGNLHHASSFLRSPAHTIFELKNNGDVQRFFINGGIWSQLDSSVQSIIMGNTGILFVLQVANGMNAGTAVPITRARSCYGSVVEDCKGSAWSSTLGKNLPSRFQKRS